jgi:methylmalonyl-CoA mutase N-terminal domain/subunit
VESGRDVVVGLNRFVEGGDAQTGTFAIDPKAEAESVARVRALRASRSAAAATAALAALDREAAAGANLFPPVLAAVEARATIGEIMQVLEARFGSARA